MGDINGKIEIITNEKVELFMVVPPIHHHLIFQYPIFYK